MEAGLKQRYVFEGVLVTTTGLHVGGGRDLNYTDSPVIKTLDGEPFIPGSSIKGAFRSTVERIAVTLGWPLRSCQIWGQLDQNCPTGNEEMARAYRDKQKNPQEKEEDLVKFLEEHLCDTCKLFGSPFSRSRILFEDAPMLNPELGEVEVRDGVGIDRDSGRAAANVKFDYEVVPSLCRFSFRAVLENPSPKDLFLTAVGLREMVSGYMRLGGLSSRGLGGISLELKPVKTVDFTNTAELIDYLRTGRTRELEPESFLDQQIGLWDQIAGNQQEVAEAHV